MKAIIPAAGLGTRFLPVTRAIPKEMLPIGSRPALELIVDEARAAGADRIAIVVSDGKEPIRKYFADAPDIAFVRQAEQRGLGHAVLQAAELLGGEKDPLLVLLGDALVTGCVAAREMARVSAAHGGASVIGCERVPREKVSRYGILSVYGATPEPCGGTSFRVDGMVEKPAPEEAPSDIAVAGRYLLDPSIFGHLSRQTPGKGGEIQLTDSIAAMLREKPVFAYAYPGRRLDIGNPDGYFEALTAFRNEDRNQGGQQWKR